jgi:hypothetical protein
VHVLNEHAARHDGAIYIGRRSKWGNPFRIGVDGDGAAVIAKYARWLRDQRDLLRALDELRGKDLLCSARRSHVPAICCCGSPMDAKRASRVALGGMIAAHISRSRGPARWPGGRSDRPPPQPGTRFRVKTRPGRP